MIVDRTILLRGPSSVGYQSANFVSESDIVAKLMKTYSKRNSAGFGTVREPLDDKWLEVSLPPLCFNNQSLLWPYAAKQIGDRLCGSSDEALVITPRNGQPLTVVNALITKMPNLSFSTEGAMMGAVTFEGLVGKGLDPSEEASYFTMGDAATNVALLGYVYSEILNRQYSLTWNGLTIIPNKGGFKVEFEQANKLLKPDACPRLDYSLTGLTASIRFTPSVVTNADSSSLENVYTSAMSMATDVGDDDPLSTALIAGQVTGDPTFALYNCHQTAGQLRYGEADRQGEVMLKAIPLVTSNALAARWLFGTVS